MGGVDYEEQFRQIKSQPDIIVCTPGRLIEVLNMKQGNLVSLKDIIFVSLDEADRMFDLGFEP